MKNRSRVLFGRLAAAGIAVLVLSPSVWAQLSIALNAKPQYASNSCRSYGLALAAGTLPGTPFPIGTAKELRTVEKDIQARLAAMATKMKSTATDHLVWKAAIEQMSSGKLELVLEYPRTPEAFYARVRELTGVSSAQTLGAVLSIALGKTPVMTSVTRVGQDNYGDGHIVTVYGVSSQPVSPTPLAILNPAVKVADKTRKACELDDVPNDDKWSAMASIEPSYDLKPFNGRYLVMWLRKK